MSTVTETAPAKVNLILRVGPPAASGLHPICSLFARLDLADEVRVSEAEADEVVCSGVSGPNLASEAIIAFREAAGGPSVVPPLRVEITKRIPVAAGLGGGSADAAATLRAARRLTGIELGEHRLRALGLALGSDVPSQLAPAHAIVEGEGERIEPVALATMGVVLIPDPDGLSTAAVYRELDRLRAAAPPASPPTPGAAPPDAAESAVSAEATPHIAAALDPAPLREAAALAPDQLAGRLANDLQPAALALRPALRDRLRALTEAGALGAAISGSGPTAFGLFASREEAEHAAKALPGSLVAEIA